MHVVVEKKPYEVKVGWGGRCCPNFENTMVELIYLGNYQN
jgi:hypothetical protein